VANPDDVVPDLPKLPPGSEFAFLEGRLHEIFAPLNEADIPRVARFGEPRSFPDGGMLFEVGKRGAGMYVILSGRVSFSRRDAFGRSIPIWERGPGHFLAEVGQLSGADSFVDVRALGPVEGILVPPEGLRALVVAEVELGERILRALTLRRLGLVALGFGGPALIGPPTNPRMRALREFLLRSGHPHEVLDPETDSDAAGLVRRHEARPEDLPLVICPDGSVLKNPGDIALARYLNVLPNSIRERGYDVAVVGAGPAGLSTAVYGASEGLSILVVDARGFGGQASASARIDNYFGFPTGVTGQDLTGRAFTQAQKFGAEFAMPALATRLSCGVREATRPSLSLHLDDGRTVSARTLVIASGARYRRPVIPTLAAFEGRGVSYWASPIEARICRGKDVVLVGGGNSAGQAAVYLSGHAARVLMLVRGPSLSQTMSRYLVDRLAATANIHVHHHTELTLLETDERGDLAAVRWKNHRTGAEEEAKVRHVFVFVGADPATEWLDGCDVALDAKGFVKTGVDLSLQELVRAGRRDMPRSLETSLPGVFAVGDVRCGSVKRVGGAIGEGAAVVQQLHAYLAELAEQTLRGSERQSAASDR
jgi:thioredoxin reductase (NADPH)